jgi:hypothetical protein
VKKPKTRSQTLPDLSQLNAVFKGEPGTGNTQPVNHTLNVQRAGKTTMARLYARCLYDLKLVKKAEPVEVRVDDLCGKFVGQTKDAAKAVVRPV